MGLMLPSLARGAPNDGSFAPGFKQHLRLRRRCTVPLYFILSGAIAFFLLALVRNGALPLGHDFGLSRQSQNSVGPLASLEAGAGNATSAAPPAHDDAAPGSPASNTSASKPLASFPPHPWMPFLGDPAPLTHLTVRGCYFPPWMFASLCAPKETPSEIAQYGHWIRVPRDMGRRVSKSYMEMYYRRSLGGWSGHSQAITDVRVLDDAEAEKPETAKELAQGGWEKVGDNLRADTWPAKLAPAHLWITRDPSAGDGPLGAVTEVDVLWGSEAEVTPWWGFSRVGGPIYGGPKDPDHVQSHVVVRRSPDPSYEDKTKTALKFRPDGTLKVLQIADLHFSVGSGKCREASLLDRCEAQGADATTAEWLASLLDTTAPDLVVLSGDQLNGQGTSWDELSVLLKVGHLVGDRGFPWAAVLGNHDTEDGGLDRWNTMVALEHMPGFVGSAGPRGKKDDEMGAGNYVLPITSGKGQNERLFTLYFLDSHATAAPSISSVWSSVTGKKESEYDWIKPSQISWFLAESAQVPAVLRPYSSAAARPDDSTFGLWPADPSGPGRRRQRPRTRTRARRQAVDVPSAGSQTLRRPNAILFQHIPLPEAYDPADLDPSTGAELAFGRRLEGAGSPKRNSGFFADGILKATEDAAEGGVPTVKVIANGHCHITDECRRVKGVYHCFAGGSSYSGYGDEGFERRARAYQIEDWGETIRTWEVLDPRVVGAGAAGATPGRWEELVLVGRGA